MSNEETVTTEGTAAGSTTATTAVLSIFWDTTTPSRDLRARRGEAPGVSVDAAGAAL